MKRTKNITLGLVLILIALLAGVAACSPGGMQGGENDAGEVAICDLSKDILGWRLSTTGTISFLDLSPRDGVYFELKDQGCEAGAFAHNEFWDTFSEEQQAQIQIGETIHIQGILTKDSGRWIVSVQTILP